jgi:hypothetical protein
MTCKDSYQEMSAFQQNCGPFLSEKTAHANLDQMPAWRAVTAEKNAERATG